MSRHTRWLAGIVVAAATLSALADIQVPPGFVVDTLLDQIEGRPPELEAIRDPCYGFGVVAASVNDSVLSVFRLSDSPVELMATKSGFAGVAEVLTVRFDETCSFSGSLYITLGEDLGGGPNLECTKVLQVLPGGAVTQVAQVGTTDDPMWCVLDFADGSAGYEPGGYLEDGNVLGAGTSLWHLNDDFDLDWSIGNLVPPGRNDLDVQGMAFDPIGQYGWRLTMADCETGTDNKAAIYQLLPDHETWLTLVAPVPITERCYRDIAFSPGGNLGAALYVADRVDETIFEVDPSGLLTPFATGFDQIESLSISADGDCLFVSDADGVYRIRAEVVHGPTLVMREPWVEDDDIHTGAAGVDSLRLLWSERLLFDNQDVSITNEDGEPIPFSVLGSNSQFMLIGFGDVLLNDVYTLTVHDTAVSAETGAAIDGDNDGLAGGDAVLTIEHRYPFDHDRDSDVDIADFAAFQEVFAGPQP